MLAFPLGRLLVVWLYPFRRSYIISWSPSPDLQRTPLLFPGFSLQPHAPEHLQGHAIPWQALSHLASLQTLLCGSVPSPQVVEFGNGQKSPTLTSWLCHLIVTSPSVRLINKPTKTSVLICEMGHYILGHKASIRTACINKCMRLFRASSKWQL